MSVTAAVLDEAVVQPKPSVLELRDFTFYGNTENSIRVSKLNLHLREGDMAMIHLDRSIKSRELVSVIQGIASPNVGDVLFQEQGWSGSDYDRHFQMRSRIGRVFEGHAWVANLNVAENVSLASLHHGKSEESIQEDVQKWAVRFGLKQVSRKRPAFVEISQLQLHQWVRAFIGQPMLLVLEQPMQSVSKSLLPKLVDAVNEVRHSGAAVLWLTNQRGLVDQAFDPPITHYELTDETLTPMKRGSRDE